MVYPKRILITGVTGTLGTTLTRLLLKDPDVDEIIGISRDEQKQRQIPTHPILKLRLADIRDPAAVARAIGSKPIDYIFHLAALKCVDTLEYHPYEAFQTNVIGTQNMVDIADQLDAKLTFTSTDKACYPVNAYGQSKALAEKIVLNAGHTVCRYGNVLGSRGSFLPSLILSLKTEGKAYLTHPDMTRFWMSAGQVAQFVKDAGRESKSGLKVPQGLQACDMPSFIKAVASFCGVEKYEIEEIGVRPGEKFHETLVTKEEGSLVTSEDRDRQFHFKSLQRFIIDVMKEDI
jgi:FlaA1/EpsC-like NDP-sugar epimerase